MKTKEVAMTRYALVVVLVGLLAAPVVAQEEAVAMPWAAPNPEVEAGASLIATGFWGDVIGIGLVTGAGPAFSISVGAGATLFNLGVVSMIFVGNPCMQSGLGQHHDALVALGYDVPTENRETAEFYSTVSLVCGGASTALSVVALVADSLEFGIASLVVGTAGAVFEILNFYGPRRDWNSDMRVASGRSPFP
jgi:hypothetical protein